MREMAWSEISVCLACWALVPASAMERHEQWHERAADVAIESTQRLDALYSGCTKTPA